MLADPIEDIVRKINSLEREVLAYRSEKIKYDILNLSATISLSSDQNAWDIEDRDVIFAASSAPRTINGIANGKPGRVLYVRAGGTSTITFTNQSGSASAANRIITPTSASITIGNNHWALFIYGDGNAIAGASRWFMIQPDA